MRRSPTLLLSVLTLALALLEVAPARAMCGCMLRPQPRPGETRGAKIVNKTSTVILQREGDVTTMTLSNDFEGAPAEFGMVIPVPTNIQRSDVKVVDDSVFAALETATAPRVQEIFEPDPCEGGLGRLSVADAEAPSAAGAPMAKRAAPRASDYGVKVESHFFAGEYEIAVLSGKDSTGLVKWLQLFKYDVPDDAREVLGSYIKQDMRFFVARVYLKEMGTARRTLRPIQVRYKTPKFMLPIRLGMVNADGPQEILAFFLSPTGRVEPVNYRAVRMPSGESLPHFAKDAWNDVWTAIFEERTRREDMRVIFLEHAGFVPQRPGMFVTRAHFKYDGAHFPEDLVLQATNDKAPFQIVMNAVKPAANRCGADDGGRQRRAREQQVLANLTGWPMQDVLRRAGLPVGQPTTTTTPAQDPWYQKLWK